MTVQEDLMMVSEVLSNKLSTLEPGGDEFTNVFNQLVKVDSMLIDMAKTDMENDKKERELEAARKNRNIGLISDWGKLGAYILFYGGMAFVMFHWEEDNTFTGAMKKWADKLVPNKQF